MKKKISSKLCSIIIRTKNEERWINICLNKLLGQTYKNFEIIIVDNGSTDATLKIIKNFSDRLKIKIIKIKKYLPGLALNQGIKKTRGEFIACLSAHCIPKNNRWLEVLVNSIDKDETIAGVYGRQEPMDFTSDNDKRDLFTVFGLDKRIQKKDSFFHNANSIIRRKCWDLINFDEKLTNIEDRIWAQSILKKKYVIVYEPSASVFHFHGIHQNKNEARLSGVINIFEKKVSKFKSGKISLSDLNICAIIPIKGSTNKINKDHQIKLTINSALESKNITSVIVSTDELKTKKIAEKYGASVPFLRPKYLSKESISLEKVYSYTIKRLEKKKLFFDIIVLLEETYPFRDKLLIDQMLNHFVSNHLECMIAAKKEYGWIWNKNNFDQYNRLDIGDIPRKIKDFFLVGIQGLCVIALPKVIRDGISIVKDPSFYIVNDKKSHIEIRDKKDIQTFKDIISKYASQ